MPAALESYLKKLENQSENSPLQEMYLWPRTPGPDVRQKEILSRVGATDYEADKIISRPYKIVKALKLLCKKAYIPADFSCVDITCGDAVVLSQVKKFYPSCHAYGVDCFKDKFETHEGCYKQGIKIYSGYIQDMFNPSLPPPEKFDVAIMLNTYRGWESADLRDHEKDLPGLADLYFERNVKYVFLTVTETQIEKLREKGFKIRLLGNGEDESIMIVMSYNSSLPNFSKLIFFRTVTMRKLLKKVKGFYYSKKKKAKDFFMGK